MPPDQDIIVKNLACDRPAVQAATLRPAFVVLSAVAATLIAVLYVRSEQPIYFWDWRHHFTLYRAYGALVEKGGFDWLVTLTDSIRRADYNLAVLAPMMSTYLVFGGDRTAYIATIVLLYLLPACHVAARLASRNVASSGVSLPQAWLAALLFWPFWIAALRGMPDVAGLIPLGYATWLVIETRFLTRASIMDGIKLGLAVWAAFLLRRWYAYACVSIECVTMAFAAWTTLSAKTNRREVCLSALKAFAANVLTAAACLLVCQLPLVVAILSTRYADLYDAYQEPLVETAQDFYAHTGLVLLAAIAAGLVRAAIARDTGIVFMAAAATLTSVLFLQTQAPGVQHVLPVLFWLFPAAVYGALWPFAAMRRCRAAGGYALVLAMAVGWLVVLVPVAHRLLAPAGPLLPTRAYPPLSLQDRTGYDALVGDLERMIESPADKIAVFASSPAISGSLLASFAPSLPLEMISDVDKRDGLRLAPLAARFAITTRVAALHLPARSQRVVQLPNEMIVNGTGLGSAYRLVAGPYRLDDGIEASIYRRARPWTREDTKGALDALKAFYPNWTIQGDTLIR